MTGCCTGLLLLLLLSGCPTPLIQRDRTAVLVVRP
jgi:hypothetical protein